MNNERLKSPTPYDDVFRTLLTDCRTLIIPVVKELFEKNLYFLLPFHLFVYENEFATIDVDPNKLDAFKNELYWIPQRLEEASRKNELSDYQKQTLIEMTVKVSGAVAEKYTNVQKGVEQIMGGQILQYEAKRILNEGIEQERVRQEKKRKQDTQLFLLMRRDNELDDYEKILLGDESLKNEYMKKYGLQ